MRTPYHFAEEVRYNLLIKWEKYGTRQVSGEANHTSRAGGSHYRKRDSQGALI